MHERFHLYVYFKPDVSIRKQYSEKESKIRTKKQFLVKTFLSIEFMTPA